MALAALAVLLFCSLAAAQGIKTKRVARVLHGSVSKCSRPAVVNYKKVAKVTPEWKEIRTDHVRPGCGRYDLLISAMTERIRTAVAKVAEREVCDCVVAKGGIESSNGLPVIDLTSAVLNQLAD